MSYVRSVVPGRACWAAVIALAMLPLAACDDDSPTGPGNGGETGTMEAVVRDGAGASSQAPALTSHASGEVSGQFQADVRVQVQVDGAWQDISGMTSLNAEAELGGGESVMGSASVEARTYERVRVIVSNAEADVDAGSDIGIGPIEVSVSLVVAGGNDVVVEYSQPVTVQADGTTRLVLDLNSEAWLTADAVNAGAVTSAAFEGAAAVMIQ
jgi:hypothetical protein